MVFSRNKKDIWQAFVHRGRILTLVLLFTTAAIGAANVASAQETGKRISIRLENVSVLDALREINRLSGNVVVFRSEEVEKESKRVSLDMQDAPVADVVKAALKGTSLNLIERDGRIVVVPQQLESIVKGSVHDENNQPLPGVTVVLKGTTLGTATNVEGKYNLTLPGNIPNPILVFSFVGMKTKEITCQGKTTLNVKLEEEVKSIDEVVVTGYFNKAKSSYTGEAKTYSSEELKRVNPVNLLSALSVLDPSFKMVENNVAGSNPNVIPDFQIRGMSSLPDNTSLQSSFAGNPNMPTFIMDGFEVEVEKVFDLDPERIESMTILKDAAATAIYGSRASNGVVVIITKTPAPGKLRLQYNLDLSFNIPDLTDYDLLKGSEKLDLEKNAGYFEPFGSAEQTEQRKEDYNFRLGLVQRGFDTYWLNKPLRMALGHKHSISIEGGEDVMRYSLDLTYDRGPGVMKESGRERMGMGVMLLYRFKK